jgi:hypothetical protein
MPIAAPDLTRSGHFWLDGGKTGIPAYEFPIESAASVYATITVID